VTSPRRPRTDKFYDSAFGLPDFEADATRGGSEARLKGTPDGGLSDSPSQDSSAFLEAVGPLIATTIQDDGLREQVFAALRERRVSAGGEEVWPAAALIVSDVSQGVTATITKLRQRARPDAAILLLLDDTSVEAVADAHAAGASACLRLPLVPAELLSFTDLTLDSRAARVHAADLARKLDLESHLASIGRISAGLSHELGTPLQIALTNVEVLRDQCARLVQALHDVTLAPSHELAAPIARARATLKGLAEHGGLDGMIHDSVEALGRATALLRLMRELVGKRDRAPLQHVSLLGLVKQVLQWLKADLEGVAVDVVGSDVYASTDPIRLGQVLQNLTANAVHAAKSLSAPRVRLHVYKSASRAVVSVRDNGPGIPEDLQDRLFEPFFTTRRGKGGTGLGLALCREYALQLGADISFWSMPGRGACFRIQVPPATAPGSR
jgi:two-component system sensor histidine kinase HupT/HoxJ